MAERTTVRLPEELLLRAKRKAAAEGRTLTALIEDGLRLVTAESRRPEKRKRVLPRISKASGGVRPEWGCEWITLDRDYARFPGLRWTAPAKP